jgi:hypothetical protein
VTSLEPRTPHQPEKLKKLSKNDLVVRPSIFPVNEKCGFVSTCLFNRVHAVHKLLTGNSATGNCNAARTLAGRGFSCDSSAAIKLADETEPRHAAVNIAHSPRRTRRFETQSGTGML